MNRGRKFNIWIAYTDLFTNLTTFLFISAIGIAAAYGSGLLDVVGLGTSSSCPAATELTMPIRAEASLLVDADAEVEEPNQGLRRGCSKYFRIDGVQFKAADRNLRQLQYRSGEPLPEKTLRQRVCVPIWRLLADDSFANAGGRITFVGLSLETSGYAYPAECGDRAPGPLLTQFPTRKWQNVKGIRECQIQEKRRQERMARGENPKPTFDICETVFQCLREHTGGIDNGRQDCYDFVAAVRRDDQNTLACRKQWQDAQAKALFDFCESAQFASDFPSGKLDLTAKNTDAGRADVRQDSWSNVGFEGASVNGPRYRRKGRIPAVTPADAESIVLVRVDISG